jgi:hypothetical protein
MMDRDPPISFGAFVQGLSRKFEESQAETAQKAALHTEEKQAESHQASENETAKFSKAKGERRSLKRVKQKQLKRLRCTRKRNKPNPIKQARMKLQSSQKQRGNAEV